MIKAQSQITQIKPKAVMQWASHHMALSHKVTKRGQRRRIINLSTNNDIRFMV